MNSIMMNNIRAVERKEKTIETPIITIRTEINLGIKTSLKFDFLIQKFSNKKMFSDKIKMNQQRNLSSNHDYQLKLILFRKI